MRSLASIDGAHLKEADRAAVEQLFAAPPTSKAMPDGFRYRLTRETQSGPESVEVAENHVPAAVRSAIKDELV